MRKACVLRIGGIGDVAIATSILPLLKRDGYEVTFISKWYSHPVLKNNPYVDIWKKWRWGVDKLKGDKLKEKLQVISSQYDRFINLSGSLEVALLVYEGSPQAELPKAERHSRYNKNYYRHALDVAGYEKEEIQKPQVFLSKAEEKAGKALRRTIDGKDGKVVMWVLSGTSFHKTYPLAETVMLEMLDEHEDLRFITVGDEFCHMIEPKHERALNRSGIWNLRRSIIMSKFVDLVVTTETGMAHIAAAHGTPMVILLSHSSQENLTQYWDNTTVIEAGVQCHPCHRQIYSKQYCKRDSYWDSPICMSKIPKDTVKNAIKNKLF